MTEQVITLDNIAKQYRLGPPWARRSVDALKPLTLAVAREEMLAVVGESGSGKTTLAKLCLGLVRPTSGVLTFEGRPYAADRRSLRGKLAAVLQNPAASLNPQLKIGRSIAEPMRLAGLADAAEADRRARVLLERVGLPAGVADRHPAELSGGQRQRVAIARALSTSPRMIVFDEAVSALDVSVQAQVLNLITDLQREVGFASLFITHDIAVARYIADRVIVMRNGTMEADLPAKALYEAAEHRYIRELQTASGLIGLDGRSVQASG